MAELREIFVAAGATNVRTLIQSGNVVYRVPEEDEETLARRVREALEARLETPMPLLRRSGAELRRILDENPFLADGVETRTLHVALLSAAPSRPERLDEVERLLVDGEEMIPRGRELYLHLPHGIARTKLTHRVLETRLEVAATVRGWRTLTRLAAMIDG